MAYDFASDANCKALWRFDSSGLLIDSKGGNTLTVYTDGGSPPDPYADTSHFVAGSSSAHIDYTDPDAYQSIFLIDDANLDAGFPLKNGDSAKTITMCCWIRPGVLPTLYDSELFRKGKTTTNTRSLSIETGGTAIILKFGYNTGSSEEQEVASCGLATGNWHHVAVVVDGVNKTYKVRVYKVSDNSVTNYTGVFTNVLNVEDGPLQLGNYYDGNIDQMVVFSSLLTDEEIDAVRGQDYIPPPGITNDAVVSMPSLAASGTISQLGGWFGLPALSAEGVAATGSAVGNILTLPGLNVNGYGREGSVGNLSMPSMSISGTTASKGAMHLPALSVAASGFHSVTIEASLTLPAISVSASASFMEHASADFGLPSLSIDSTVITDTNGSGACSLPPLSMIPIATGDGGSQSTNSASQTARFENYILRYYRW